MSTFSNAANSTQKIFVGPVSSGTGTNPAGYVTSLDGLTGDVLISGDGYSIGTTITGQTIILSGNFANPSGNYMPITGGNFTGPISGPSATFTTITGTNSIKTPIITGNQFIYQTGSNSYLQNFTPGATINVKTSNGTIDLQASTTSNLIISNTINTLTVPTLFDVAVNANNVFEVNPSGAKLVLSTGTAFLPSQSGSNFVGTLANPFFQGNFENINAVNAVSAATFTGINTQNYTTEDPFFRYNQQPFQHFVNNAAIVFSTGLSVANYGCWDGQNVWYGNYLGANIYSINQNGIVSAPYSLGGGTNPLQLCWDGSYVWVASADNFARLERFNPTIGTVDQIHVLNTSGTSAGLGGIQGIVWDGQNLYLGIPQQGSGTGFIGQFNEASGTITKRIYGQINVNGLCITDEVDATSTQRYVWGGCEGFVSKINVNTFSGVTFSCSPYMSTYRICTDGTYVYAGDFNSGVILKFLASNGNLASIWTSVPLLNSIEFDGKNIWAVGNKGTAFIHDRNSGNVINSVSGVGINGLVFDGSYMWTNDGSGTVYKSNIGEIAGSLKSWDNFTVLNTGNTAAFNFNTRLGLMDYNNNDAANIKTLSGTTIFESGIQVVNSGIFEGTLTGNIAGGVITISGQAGITSLNGETASSITLIGAGNVNITTPTSSTIVISGTATPTILLTGTAPILVTGSTIGIGVASTSTNGYLTSSDWNTFNSAGTGLSNYLPLKGGTLTGGLIGTSAAFSSITGTNISGSTINVPVANHVVINASTITGTTINATNITGTTIFENGFQVLTTGIGLGTVTTSVSNGVITISGSSTGVPSNVVISGTSTALTVLNVPVLSGTIANITTITGTTAVFTNITGTKIFENGIQVVNSGIFQGSVTGSIASGVITISGSSIANGTYVHITGDAMTGGLSGTSASFTTITGSNIAISNAITFANSGTVNVGSLSDPANVIYTNSLITAPHSEVWVVNTSGTGFGSTATTVRHFSGTTTNIGSDITYAQTAVSGSTFTINTDGVYSITYNEGGSSATDYGITLNATAAQQTNSPVNFTNLLFPPKIAYALPAANSNAQYGTISVTLGLHAGDVIRGQTQGNNGNTIWTGFRIVKLF